MFAEDVIHDGETQTGAAILGGKIGQEEFLFIAGRDTAAGVGDQQLDGFVSSELGRDQQAFDQRIAHGFGGVIDQVDDDSLELLGIDLDGRQAGGELDVQVDGFEASGEDVECVAHDFIQIAGHGLRGGEARETREFVGQRFDRFDFARNGGGALAQNAL